MLIVFHVISMLQKNGVIKEHFIGVMQKNIVRSCFLENFKLLRTFSGILQNFRNLLIMLSNEP